jgi:hypothetical protein
MRKILAASLVAVTLMIGSYGVCAAQSKTTDFSGKWALDKGRTSDLPPSLESYTMTVTQDAEQLTIETDRVYERPALGKFGAEAKAAIPALAEVQKIKCCW